MVWNSGIYADLLEDIEIGFFFGSPGLHGRLGQPGDTANGPLGGIQGERDEIFVFSGQRAVLIQGKPPGVPNQL